MGPPTKDSAAIWAPLVMPLMFCACLLFRLYLAGLFIALEMVSFDKASAGGIGICVLACASGAMVALGCTYGTKAFDVLVTFFGSRTIGTDRPSRETTGVFGGVSCVKRSGGGTSRIGGGAALVAAGITTSAPLAEARGSLFIVSYAISRLKAAYGSPALTRTDGTGSICGGLTRASYGLVGIVDLLCLFHR